MKAFSLKGHRISSSSISACSRWWQTRLNAHGCQEEAQKEQLAKLHGEYRETESALIPQFLSREPLGILEFSTRSQLTLWRWCRDFVFFLLIVKLDQ